MFNSNFANSGMHNLLTHALTPALADSRLCSAIGSQLVVTTTTPQTFLSWSSPAHQFDEARAAASLVLVSLLVVSRAQDMVTRRCCRCCPVFKGVERLPQTYDVRCASYLVVCAQATATCHCGAYVGLILLNFCEQQL